MAKCTPVVTARLQKASTDVLKYVDLNTPPAGTSPEQVRIIAKELHTDAAKACEKPETAAKAAFVLGYSDEVFAIDTSIPLHTRYTTLREDYPQLQQLVALGNTAKGEWGRKMGPLMRDFDFVTDQFFASHTTAKDAVPADQPKILGDVLAKVAALKAEGKDPLVLLDLDDTLFSPAGRSIRILNEYVEYYQNKYPETLSTETLAALMTVQPEEYVYNLVTDLKAHWNVTDSTFLNGYFAFWKPRFFTSDYLAQDTAYEAAPEYVIKLQQAGAKLVYLSGRQEEPIAPGAKGMREGTLAALARYGFPAPNDTSVFLFLKGKFADSDSDFKKSVFDRIDRMATIVASFDNDPKGDMNYRDRWPNIYVVRVGRCHTPNPESGKKLPDGKETPIVLQDITRLPDNVLWIQDWRMSNGTVSKN